MIQDLVVTAVFVGYAVAVLLLFGTVLTWVERKQAAIMSDRIGANRAYEPAALAVVAVAITWGCMVLIQIVSRFAPKTAERPV